MMESDDPGSATAALLAQELRALISKLKRRLREQANSGDLTPSQISVMLRLERYGPTTTSALARAEGMRPQSMAPILAVLEQAGMVQGEPDAEDRRQTLLSLTESCRNMIAEGRAARQDWLAQEIRLRLTPDEQAQVAESVNLMKRLVED